MSNKARTSAIADTLVGDRFLNKLIRLEHTQTARKGVITRQFTEKLSHIVRSPNPMQSQKAKPKTNPRLRSPVATIVTPPKEPEVVIPTKEVRLRKYRNRSVSSGRSPTRDTDNWGQILMSNKSREKVSNFSNFDPLRTLHFLSKELHAKLKQEDCGTEVLQMVLDIQHALRRIPPEVSTLLRPHDSSKSTATKMCQTPPTLYQEDTEKFQKIMEENTLRLETSCRQLETVCTNLQNEKEMTEKELDEARRNIEFLCDKVKELEKEVETTATSKVAQLEDEKRHLQLELETARHEANVQSLANFKKIIEELKKQKTNAEEKCSRLEYDMTLLKMEKEKFVTMLAIRDREIKEVQEEMSKIQDQVNEQLKKLNIEVVTRSNSMRSVSDPFIQQFIDEIGDTTISSIATNETESAIKEMPCGDGKVEGVRPKPKVNSVEVDVQCEKGKDAALDDLLVGLTPSLKALLTTPNL